MNTKIMKANINDYIYVRLTEEGEEIWYDYHQDIFKEVPMYMLEIKLPEPDKNGYRKFQMWNFMQIFGPHFHMGFGGPCETEVKIEVYDE